MERIIGNWAELTNDDAYLYIFHFKCKMHVYICNKEHKQVNNFQRSILYGVELQDRDENRKMFRMCLEHIQTFIYILYDYTIEIYF